MNLIRDIFNVDYRSRLANIAWGEGFTVGVAGGMLLAGMLALAMLLISLL